MGRRQNKQGESPQQERKLPSELNKPLQAPADVNLFETNTSYRPGRYDTFEFSSKVTCFAFSKDAPLLAVGVEIGGVYLFDLTVPDASVAAPSELIGVVRSMHFGPQNGFGEQILYGAFDDGYIRRWLIRNMTEMIQIDCLYFGQEVQSLLVSSGGRSVTAIARPPEERYVFVGKQSRLAVWSALYDNCSSYLTIPWISNGEAYVDDGVLLPDVLLHPRAPPNAEVFHVAVASPTEGILIFNVIVVEPQYTHHFDASVLPVRALPGSFSKLAAIPQQINDQQVVVLAATVADAKDQVALVNLQPDAENYPGCQVYATLVEINVKPEHAITSIHWVNLQEEVELSVIEGVSSREPQSTVTPCLSPCDDASQEARCRRMVLCLGTDKGSILLLECIHVHDNTGTQQQRFRVRLVYDLDGNRGPVSLQEVPSEVVMGRSIFASCCNDTMCHLWELQEVKAPTTVDNAASHAAQRCAYLEMLRHRCMPEDSVPDSILPFVYSSDQGWPVELRNGASGHGHPPLSPLQGRSTCEGNSPFLHSRRDGRTLCMPRSLKQAASDRQKQQTGKAGVDAVVEEVLNRVCKDMSLWEKQKRDSRPRSEGSVQVTASSSVQRERPLRTHSERREKFSANDRAPWNDRFHVT